MKRVQLTLVILGTLCAVAAAQDQRTVTKPADVLAVEKNYADAYRTCNLDLMDRVLADDFIHMHSSGATDDRQKWLTYLRECPLEELQVEVTKVRSYGDTALVHGTFKVKNRKMGPRLSGPISFTRVYVRQSGAWRLVLSQQSASADALRQSR